MVLGSEGRLGIITEATIHVRPVPPEREILGYLFPPGRPAWPPCATSPPARPRRRSRACPMRMTAFSFATRTDPTPLDRVKSKALQLFLERKGWDLEAMCLSFIGYEGSADHVAAQRKLTERIAKRHGGLCIGTSPGELYDQKKFDTPYIRDFLLDRGAQADVFRRPRRRGAQLHRVYDNVMAAGRGAFHQLGVPGYLMCHMSHSYHAGACLYFTFALNPPDGHDGLEDYGVVKRAIQQAFVDSGATLSHRHAVGTEHAQWLEEDISTPGVAMLRALFEGTDPGRNLKVQDEVAAGDSDRVQRETLRADQSSNSGGRAGGPRHSLDARESSQTPP